ncbi:tetratricopeptide TPR_2 [Nonlabens dokdonensis DSW-6]|uniref:histidine kinase n=1 Tax=Nonlabens dokdonensis (strain DSM 17205 / KCTC 12402 / DSW-6) TaxID=592029 RepID=L7W748_NONDD|nr:tetratricopeptide TPR_2 [Nonlabens dokdonensis DSW-6]
MNYYSSVINNPTQPNDLAKAYKFFIKEKAKHSNNDNSLANEIYATQQLARIQRELGYTSENEKLNLESLRLLDKIKSKTDWTQITYMSIINELGKVYREKRDYARAIALYDEALTTASSPAHQAILYNNKGQVFEHQEDLENAIYYYEKAYENAIEANNPRETARALSNLSFTKSKLDVPEAESGLIKALNIRLKNNYTADLGSNYDHLSRFYFHSNDMIATKKYSDSFLELANKNNLAPQLIMALKLKIETGEPEYAIEYIQINDSLNNLKTERRNNFNYYVYQYDKKEKDLQKSQLFNERLLYLLLFIALASISIYFILKYKHKKEKLLEIYHTETRLSRKIHDEVANDVYHVMTQLQTSSNNNKELLDDLEHIYNRTRDISRQNSTIDLEISFAELLSDLFLSYKDDDVNVITKGLQLIDWDNLKDIQKTTVYRILQELLTNMKKHSNASIVVVSFEQSGKSFIINYKDNGQGTALIKGNGLQNTENRIHSINGTITFESAIEKGFKATIRI